MSRAVSSEQAAEQVYRTADAIRQTITLLVQILAVCATCLGLFYTLVIAPIADRQQRTEDRQVVIIEKLGRVGQQVNDMWQWQREHHR